jgi:GT2 family glycosyltransferase
MMEKIYILLPVFNRKNITEKIIKCLCKQNFQNYHLILVDDGSTDGTTKMVQSYIGAEQLTVIRGTGDWWCFGSFQQGINWLKEQSIHSQDTILLINDDVTFEEDFLETARSILKDRTSTLLLAQCLSEQTGVLLDSGVCANLKTLKFNQAKSQDEINCLSTRGLFLRWQDLVKIGDFYPRLLPHYTGDYEFTIRAHRKGFTLCTNPHLKLWLNEETTGFQDYQEKRFFTFLRNFFSKKSVLNPVYWTPFIVLICPKPWIPINIARVWASSLLRISRHAFIALVNSLYRDSPS